MTFRGIGILTLAIWAGSLILTYSHTREKWYDLGLATGESTGQVIVLEELCSIGQEGSPTEPVTLALGVKAKFVDVVGQNGALSIYCPK